MLRALLMLFLLCFLTPLAAIDTNAEYHIVFIHLGPKLPPYIQTALDQANLFNPEGDIILVADQEAINKIPAFPDYLTVIATESISQSIEHKTFSKKSRLDKHSKQGFWFYSTERLFYLDDLMSQYDLHNVFHAENDNLIYADLGKLLPIFVKNYPGIAATFESDDRGCPGFIYVASKDSIHMLSHLFLANVRTLNTDMIILNAFRVKFGKKYIDLLPNLMNEYINEHELVSLANKKSSIPSKCYANHIDQFQSLFDGCSYGQFFGGIDPGNGPDGPGFLNVDAVFNCSYMTMSWETDSIGRNIPYAGYGGKKFRLNNLHVHSKNLKALASKTFAPWIN